MKRILRANIVAAAAVVFVLVFTANANATLLDAKDLRIRYLFPDITTDFLPPIDVVVGPGVEADLGFATPVIDVSNVTILFNFTVGGSPASFNGFQFIDFTDSISAFSSVAVSSTNLAFDISAVTFDANNIWVNFQGLSSGLDGFVELTISSDSAFLPEPFTLGLLGAGLLGLGFATRR